MAFRFTCPQGHLLEGDEAQAGQHCQCPQCGMVFVIPQPAPSAPAAFPGSGLPGGGLPGPDYGRGYGPSAPTFPGGTFDAPDDEPPPAFPNFGHDADADAEPEAERVLHIPCPNGHELETPEEMLNQEVLCPHCGVQFLLRERDSRESRELRERREALELQIKSKMWLNWSIVLAVVVVLAIAAAIVIANR